MRPFDVQMAAGVALHRGRLVQLATGEGKTLAAVAPASSTHSTGQRRPHLHGERLPRRARRGVDGRRSTGPSVSSQRRGHRRHAARTPGAGPTRADVTYVTAKEAGFDYLRDHTALDPSDVVHRGHDARDRGRGRLHPDRRSARSAGHCRRRAALRLTPSRLAAVARTAESGCRLHRRRVRPHRRPDRSRLPRSAGTLARRRARRSDRITCCSAPSTSPCTPRRCSAAIATTSCATAASRSSTSGPAGSPTTGDGRTASSRRSKPRKASRCAPKAACSARSRCSTSCGSTRASSGMTATAEAAADEFRRVLRTRNGRLSAAPAVPPRRRAGRRLRHPPGQACRDRRRSLARPRARAGRFSSARPASANPRSSARRWQPARSRATC